LLLHRVRRIRQSEQQTLTAADFFDRNNILDERQIIIRPRSFLPLLLLAILLPAALAKGRNVTPNLPVTTSFADADAAGAVADIQSDALGSYYYGVDAVTSYLTAGGYNGIIWGDWQFGTVNSTLRKVSVSFANPILVADEGRQIQIRHSPPRL
jgi:hypothetical protein